MQKIGLIILATLLLASCSSFYTSNGEKHYLQSRNGPDLVVPPPLTGSNISQFYNLPAQTQDARVSIQPPTSEGG